MSPTRDSVAWQPLHAFSYTVSLSDRTAGSGGSQDGALSDSDDLSPSETLDPSTDLGAADPRHLPSPPAAAAKVLTTTSPPSAVAAAVSLSTDIADPSGPGGVDALDGDDLALTTAALRRVAEKRLQRMRREDDGDAMGIQWLLMRWQQSGCEAVAQGPVSAVARGVLCGTQVRFTQGEVSGGNDREGCAVLLLLS